MSRTRFPPIGTFGYLSDCNTGALVSNDGSVEWLCTPRFDSPSVFAALLDRGAGHFRFAPRGVMVPLSRRYEPGTLVIETTWFTDTGWVVVRDALTIAEWEQQEYEGRTRPQTDPEADRSLLRIATCIDGEVEIEMECVPAFAYGTRPATWSGGELGEAIAMAGDDRLDLTSDLELSLEGGAALGRTWLREDDSCFCAITWGDGDLGGPRSAPEALERMESTREFWRAWLRHGTFPDHPWRAEVQRSALVLKGLTYAPSGALVAAPTTSLPEEPGGERNWDYRYTWIRDATFSLWALHLLGFEEEARDFIDFFAGICRKQPQLQVMYGIEGERELTERELEHLSGYDGSRPVRIGNAAFDQRQNDVWGALLDSVYIHAKALGELRPELWGFLEAQVEAAIEAWPHPDQGIWESRGEPRHYTSSKIMIWVAADRGARLARHRGEHELADRWQAKAREFRDEILERGVRDGVFRQHYETDALDASLLLLPIFRFLPPADPRVAATVRAIAEDLTDNGYVRRYRIEEAADDGLGGGEGTFLICSFWLVSALSEIGESRRARALCERLLGSGGELDLYAEELDPKSGRQLGNFPQAFTHLALINAVSHVIADELREEEREMTAVFSELRSR